MIFSQCKAHCQVKCGEEDKEKVCDESKCMPGCVCPEGEFMWANGKACSSICFKPTQAPEKPKACMDIMPDCTKFAEKCDDLISGPTLQTACAFTCKNKDACGDFFEPKNPAPTPAPVAEEPKSTCKDLYPKQCQLEVFKKRCDPVKYSTFALGFCRKSCGNCDESELKPMKVNDGSRETNSNSSPDAVSKPTCVDTMKPAYMCENLRDNCMTVKTMQIACKKTCGLCDQTVDTKSNSSITAQVVANPVQPSFNPSAKPVLTTQAPSIYQPPVNNQPVFSPPDQSQQVPTIYQPPNNQPSFSMSQPQSIQV